MTSNEYKAIGLWSVLGTFLALTCEDQDQDQVEDEV
jgi:hypothetical protein